jgi:serine/threonine-protein kinase
MTPERWRQIDALFDSALRLDPADRSGWLRAACAGDESLRAEVSRLLSLDEQAGRERFLTPPEPPVPDPKSSPSSAGSGARSNRRPATGGGSVDSTITLEEAGGFTPRAAIIGDTDPRLAAETQSLFRARLRVLPLIYILIFGMFLFWRNVIVRSYNSTLSAFDLLLIVSLGGMAVLLSSRWRPSLRWLKIAEVAMISVLASRFAFAEYRFMLTHSLRGDPMRAQIVLKNTVLLTSILILTYGIFVPKRWQRVALLAGPLALLPFLILLVLYLGHPGPMDWLWHPSSKQGVTPLALFSLDAMLLIILAIGSAYGAYTISRLRSQVVEARQLGQYHLRRRIGSGGMGEVYLAEHHLLKRPCALKLIRPADLSDPRMLERFEREVRLTATLSHWNTVEIFDYGRTEDGTYYYVMEYLPGLSLAELVERHGPLPPGRAVYLLRQVCLALREAHASGLIHRDVKPSNIFAARRGGMDDVAKLLDFGLVRPVAAAPEANLSGEGQILGTPLFMSPEQATGSRALDERSDIYSLGAVAYYLLTGRPPFPEGSGIEVMIAHVRDPAVPPSQLRRGIPDDLERAVLRCLAKKPADRFPDTERLEQALADCACSADWDQARAAQWWRDVASGLEASSPAAVSAAVAAGVVQSV